MSQPITGTNNALVTDLQGQSQSSGLITVFEVYLQDSDIGGAGVDKLYFHNGANGTADITWYSLLDDSDFGSTTSTKYGLQTYSAFPVESEGWEIRGSGTGSLPRPTVRFANINQYWGANLAKFDDLIGAKVIRRRTLEKYLSTNPPVEFNRDVYYIERKLKEDATMVEFELASAFDVQGIKLPRRSIIAARCPWKYKDSDQGGCDWAVDNRFSVSRYNIPGGSDSPTTYTLYFDKDDNRVTNYAVWGDQGDTNERKANLYKATSYSVGDYVEYYRPIGGLYPVSAVSDGTNERTLTLANAAARDVFSVGDFTILKGFTHADQNYKSIPVYVKAKGSGSTYTITVEDDNSVDGDTVSTMGYVQATRVTLYKCIVAHELATGDTADDIVKPTNISYWEFGDVCGKRLNSCAIRYGHEPGYQGVTSIATGGAMSGGNSTSGGSGYTSAPTVTVDLPDSGTDRATAVATIESGKVKYIHVTHFGSGYTTKPNVTITGGSGSGATAVADIGIRKSRNVQLPFGGFPGAALY